MVSLIGLRLFGVGGGWELGLLKICPYRQCTLGKPLDYTEGRARFSPTLLE